MLFSFMLLFRLEHGMHARPAVAVFNVCRSRAGSALNCEFHCFLRSRSEQDDRVRDGGIAPAPCRADVHRLGASVD